MAGIVWDWREKVNASDIHAWRASADDVSQLLVIHVPKAQDETWREDALLTSAEIFTGGDGTYAICWPSDKAAARLEQSRAEHRALLLILQEALMAVSQHNADLASRLAARAYVNLKTDPQGQRRFDGLLHRFTGVLHRSPRADS